MDRLNYFEPYSSPPEHENQLTRAYLVVLRLVPFALADFLTLVREDQRRKDYDNLLPTLSELGEEVRAETQTRRLATDRNYGFSLLMTDEHFEPSEPVGVRGGEAVYDGVVTTNEHVLTIENKPHVRDVWEGQLSPSLPDEYVPLEFEERAPLVVSWRQILDRLASLQGSEYLSPAGSGLVEDFLEYVGEYFPYLNPYSSFDVCGSNLYLLGQRCRQILEALGEEERVQEKSKTNYLLELEGTPTREVYLRPDRDDEQGLRIRASTHPGDLTGQARALYDRIDRDEVARFADHTEWAVSTNLHLSYRGTHLVYSSSEIGLAEYIDYWKRHRSLIGQTRGDEQMNRRVRGLLDDGLLTNGDYAEFDQAFLQTEREHVNVNPGLNFIHWWPLEVARDRDDESDQFVADVREAFNDVLGLWGQRLPE
jgi:hypothetical protein